MIPTAEEWRSIPGYEGFYKVSILGRVKTVGRTFIKSNGQRCVVRERIRSICSSGRYNTIDLSKQGIHTTEYVHQLVMRAFVGEPLPGMEVCHESGDTSDNRLVNLRYDTRAANQADRAAHGTSNAGVAHGMSKLTDEQILEMRAEYKRGAVTYRDLGNRYDVTQWAVGLIIRRQRWTHI